MLTALVAAFLGGLILNLMPCVFPVVSLKAFGLLQLQQRPAAARAEGAGFMAGVVLTMLALAGVLLAARASGAAVGWGFQLQSPLVIALLALVMLGAALNLLGLFEVGLALQRIAPGAGERSGFLGAALTGALAIVVATPCTGPFMAGAVGYALVQPPVVALAIFLALALGFAAPFTLISWSPALARRLPRPGPWMAVLKQALAFPMFGAFAWLAWVLARQTGADTLGLLLACGVVLGLVGWLYGMAQRRHLAGRPHRLLYATTVLGLLLLAPALATMRLASAPAAASTSAVASTAGAPASAPLAWSPQRVADLRGKGKPIFVDFTASWCITCQVNDKAALSTQTVKDAVARTGTVYLVADSTNYNADIEQALGDFGRGGLPLYVVYPADGGPPQLLPQLLSPGIVVAALEHATGTGK